MTERHSPEGSPAKPSAKPNGRKTTQRGLVWPFELPHLRFAYDALEPAIDAATMRLHHAKHHQAYVDGLNDAIADHAELHGLTIEQLLHDLKKVPADVRERVRNQGGGHANHQFFWEVIGPPGDARPAGDLAAAIDRTFGSFRTFKDDFVGAGISHFASGWVFLVARPRQNYRLEILSLPNQDSVLSLSEPAHGLLCCDLWEHAYYLQHQNRRAEWLQAFWKIVDWEAVAARFDDARESRKPH